MIAGIGEPQNRLRDGDVAPDFLVRRVCGKSFPEVEIFLFVERKSRKKQTRLSGRPTVPRHHVRLVGQVDLSARYGYMNSTAWWMLQPSGKVNCHKSSLVVASTWHSVTRITADYADSAD